MTSQGDELAAWITPRLSVLSGPSDARAGGSLLNDGGDFSALNAPSAS